MIQTNVQFDAKNALLGKKPIYVFAIGGQARVYSTHDLVVEGVTGALPAYVPWLKTPQGATQTIDILNGQSSIGELTLEVVDQGGSLRGLVGSSTLEGQSATLSTGYPGMDFANFVTLHVYRLYKIVPSATYTSWIFSARDLQMVAKRSVYIHPENGLAIQAANPWIVMGTPAEIAQAVYLLALQRPVTEIDRVSLAALDSGAEGLFKTVRPFLFVLTAAFEAKQFLETEIYKACGLYPVIDNLGRLSLKAFRAPAAGVASAFTFNADNMTVLPSIDRQPIMNEILFSIDYDGSKYQNELVYVDAASVSLYGRAAQLVVQSQGLRTVYGAQWVCEEVAARLFTRFAGTPAGLRGGALLANIEAFLLTMPVWAGDYVKVTHPLMPNLLTGALGVTDRVYEVVDRTPDFANGRMRYRLLDTGLTGQAAANLFAPSGRDFIVGTSGAY